MRRDRNADLLAALIYTPLALAAGLAFFLATLLTGDYTLVARIGGSLWVFGLSMIILMPTLTPWLRKRLG